MSKKKLKPSPNAKMHPKVASAKTVFSNNGYAKEDLSFDDFYTLSQQPCYYCNAKPLQTKNRFLEPSYTIKYGVNDYNLINCTFIYNGLDRIDSNKPHSKENCVPCCKVCNYAKLTMSVAEFKTWVISIYNNFIKKSK